ncbi:MAG: DegT/DnrJ/EryC1/StrS aminotransferase family protein [Nitrososphaerota archaeon]
MIPIYKPLIDDEDLVAVSNAVKSGWVSSKGKELREFEDEFSKYVGKRHGVSTSSGTSALHLALAALGIGKGDEVIVPDFTFVSPVNAVIYQNAVPVLVDAEYDTWGIDPEIIAKAISRKTKAIIVAHIYGNSAKIDEISEIANEKDIYLIEDCAESIGATYKGKMTGTRGIISCFSFYGNKVITTGEGGMCLTDDDEINERLTILRDHGMNPQRRYWHDFVGFNYRMTNMQAALGLAQLKKIDDIIKRKRRIARFYQENLSDRLDVQRDPPNQNSVFWLYSILAKNERVREKIVEELTKNEIESRGFFYPVHVMPPYRNFSFVHTRRAVSNDISNRGINLPSYPQISDEELIKISNIINRIAQLYP